MITYVIACDSARPWQYGFQDPATPIMSGIIHLHNNIIFYLIIIACVVCWLLFRAIFLFNAKKNKSSYKDFTHSTSLEIGWTLAPAVLLLLLAGPSFALLYAMDEAPETKITLKVIGHQWYWSYEYTDACNSEGDSIIFDSYMLSNIEDLVPGNLRLLEVDNQVVLPTDTHIRVCISSADVLHSWAVPALGVKIDACPGRLNMVSIYIDRVGLFYGQCSEICGVNHGFMPIVVHSISPDSYLSWVESELQ